VIGWVRGTPRWVVAVVLVYLCGLLIGTVAHVSDLVRGGLYPYSWAPAWLNLYWASLAVLDSLAGLLLIAGRRLGVDLACAIVVTDLATNWYATYGIQHRDFFAQPGLQRLTGFALFVLVTAPFVRRWLSPLRDSSSRRAGVPD
jgi:hypothetical protein